MKAVLESVRAHNASVMGEKDDSAAPATVFHVKEVILDHCEATVVLACCLPQHDIVVLFLTLAQNALDQVDLVFAHLKFKVLLQKLDHALQ